jgi:hypothetical protein
MGLVKMSAMLSLLEMNRTTKVLEATLFINEVKINFDMIGTSMEGGIGGCPDVVTPYGGWGGEVKAKVTQHGLEPNEFGGNGSKGAVFGFSAGAGDCSLFAGGSRNEIWA